MRTFAVGLLWVAFITGPAVSVAAGTDPYFGLHIHDADAVKWPEIPFGSWRLWDAQVSWPALEPERGKWDFSKMDRYVAMADQSKVEILLPLGLSPGWASARPKERSSYNSGNAAEPAAMTDWVTYVDTVARRYSGKIKAYEIWNEPTGPGFFSGSTEKLVELTCAAYKKIKAVDANAIVVSPSATSKEKGVKWLDDFLSKGGGRCIDAVGFHFYTWAHEPPEEIVPLVGKVRDVMGRNGVGSMPLWNTETGWYIENLHAPVNVTWKVLAREEAAAYVGRAFILGKAQGLARFYWYAWDDGKMGLMEREDGSLKASAVAYRNTVEWLKGVSAVTCGPQGKNIMVCELKSGSRVSHVVWSTGFETVLTVPKEWKADAQRDLLEGSGRALNEGLVRVRSLPLLVYAGAKH